MAIREGKVTYDDERKIITVDIEGDIFTVNLNTEVCTDVKGTSVITNVPDIGMHHSVLSKLVLPSGGDFPVAITHFRNAPWYVLFSFASPGCGYYWNGTRWVYRCK